MYYTTTSQNVNLKAVPAASQNGKRKKAGDVIRRIQKREVSWQIKDIAQALRMTKNPDNPDRSKLHQIYDYILKDGHLKSQIRNAIFEVQSEPFLLYRNGNPDEKATELVQKLWFADIIKYIVEAELHGFSVVEGDGISPDEGSTGAAILIDREFISIEKQWILIDGTINGQYLPYGEYMQELDLLEFGNRNDLGILLEASYNVIWKFYCRSDWSRGGEKFGMPILGIEADTNNDDELDALESKAANFGADGYIVTQAGDKVNIHERTGQRMHDIWLDSIKYSDEQLSKIINGQTATSDTKAFSGSAEVQERTMQTFTMARLQNIADECNKTVIPYLIGKGFKIEGCKFDYPELVRQRERKKNGPPEPIVPDVTGETPPKPKPKPKPAKK